MLNKDRVILMTKMASYEENEGKKNIAICRYFRGDYIGWQVIKSAIASTVAFFVVLVAYVLYDFENFLENIYEIDLMLYAKKIVFAYVCIVVVYALIAYVVYTIRYRKAKESVKCYFGNLKRLNTMLNDENQ